MVLEVVVTFYITLDGWQYLMEAEGWGRPQAGRGEERMKARNIQLYSWPPSLCHTCVVTWLVPGIRIICETNYQIQHLILIPISCKYRRLPFRYKCVHVTWLDQLRWWDQVLVGDTGRCASLACSQWQCAHCTWQLCANPKSKLCLLAIASLRHPWRVRLEKNAISEVLDVRERCR